MTNEGFTTRATRLSKAREEIGELLWEILTENTFEDRQYPINDLVKMVRKYRKEIRHGDLLAAEIMQAFDGAAEYLMVDEEIEDDARSDAFSDMKNAIAAAHR